MLRSVRVRADSLQVDLTSLLMSAPFTPSSLVLRQIFNEVKTKYPRIGFTAIIGEWWLRLPRPNEKYQHCCTAPTLRSLIEAVFTKDSRAVSHGHSRL